MSEPSRTQEAPNCRRSQHWRRRNPRQGKGRSAVANPGSGNLKRGCGFPASVAVRRFLRRRSTATCGSAPIVSFISAWRARECIQSLVEKRFVRGTGRRHGRPGPAEFPRQRGLPIEAEGMSEGDWFEGRRDHRCREDRWTPRWPGRFGFPFFRRGSMGSVVGEKLARLIERSTKQSLPVILVSASCGARLREGTLSLMQMAKTCGALARHSQAGLPCISVLTDPTMAGCAGEFRQPGQSDPGRTGGADRFRRAGGHQGHDQGRTTSGLSDGGIPARPRIARYDRLAQGK